MLYLSKGKVSFVLVPNIFVEMLRGFSIYLSPDVLKEL
jgi:hypothetical protein